MTIILLFASISCVTKVVATELEPGKCCLGGSSCNDCPFGGLAEWVSHTDCGTLMKCSSEPKSFLREGICLPHEVPPQYNKCPVGNCCAAGSSCNECEFGSGEVKAGDLKGCAGNGNMQCLDEKKELTEPNIAIANALESGDCCYGGSTCNNCPFTADPHDDCGLKGGFQCRSEVDTFHDPWSCLPHEIPPRYSICPVGNCCSVGSSCNACEFGYAAVQSGDMAGCGGRGDFQCLNENGEMGENNRKNTTESPVAPTREEKDEEDGPIVQQNMDYYTPGEDLTWAENVKSAKDCGNLCGEWNADKTTHIEPNKEHFDSVECPTVDHKDGHCCTKENTKQCTRDVNDTAGWCHQSQKNCEGACQSKWGECGRDPSWLDILTDADLRPCMGFTWGTDDLPEGDINKHRCWLKTKNSEAAQATVGYTSGYPNPIPGKTIFGSDNDDLQDEDTNIVFY